MLTTILFKEIRRGIEVLVPPPPLYATASNVGIQPGVAVVHGWQNTAYSLLMSKNVVYDQWVAVVHGVAVGHRGGEGTPPCHVITLAVCAP